jgi:hypothetical protein
MSIFIFLGSKVEDKDSAVNDSSRFSAKSQDYKLHPNLFLITFTLRIEFQNDVKMRSMHLSLLRTAEFQPDAFR